jgi:hypothetical protein
MQEMLDKAAPGRYQVINAASPGMTPPRILYYYNVWLRKFSPDMLVFYPTPAFYLDESPISEKFLRQTHTAPVPLLFLRLSNKVSVAAKRFIPETIQIYTKQLMIRMEIAKHPEGWAWRSPPMDRVKLFRQHLEALITEVQSTGTEVVLLTHANRFSEPLTDQDKPILVGWQRFFPRATEDTLIAMESKANETIRLTANEHKIHLVDIAAQVAKSPHYFADFAHFTDKGAQCVASGVVNEILEMTPNDPTRSGDKERGSLSWP